MSSIEVLQNKTSIFLGQNLIFQMRDILQNFSRFFPEANFQCLQGSNSRTCSEPTRHSQHGLMLIPEALHLPLTFLCTTFPPPLSGPNTYVCSSSWKRSSIWSLCSFSASCVSLALGSAAAVVASGNEVPKSCERARRRRGRNTRGLKGLTTRCCETGAGWGVGSGQ